MNKSTGNQQNDGLWGSTVESSGRRRTPKELEIALKLLLKEEIF